GVALGQVSGDQQFLNGPTLVNGGSGTIFGNCQIGVGFGSSLINQKTGSFAIQGGTSSLDADGSVQFVNQGSITAAVGSGTTYKVNSAFLVNSGSIAVSTGTLDLNAGGSATGGFSAAAGSTLVFEHTYWEFNQGASVSGAGTVQFP